MRWALLLSVLGCSESITRDDAGRDAGGERDAGELSDAGPDAAPSADGGRDAGPVETFSGTLVFSEVQGVVDFMGIPIEVRALAPLVSFSRSSSAQAPDFEGAGCPLCCRASHYDASDPPVPSEDAGTVTISGYTGGMFADGSTAPSSITCALEGTSYGCRYTGGAATDEAGFLPATDPLRISDTITFDVEGYGAFGALSTSLMPADTVDVSEDLGNLTIDPGVDLVLNYTCPGGSCGFNAIVVSMQATQAGVTTPTSSGMLTCTVLGGTSSVVSRQAIGAMLGCDAVGANCDASLDEVRVAVVRVGLPMTGTDSLGNQITPIVVGQGEFGTSTR